MSPTVQGSGYYHATEGLESNGSRISAALQTWTTSPLGTKALRYVFGDLSRLPFTGRVEYEGGLHGVASLGAVNAKAMRGVWRHDTGLAGDDRRGILESRFWMTLLASVLAAAVTMAGIGVIRRFEPWARRNGVHFVCFAAGVLIAAAFLHIIPEAFSMTTAAPAFVLAGFVALHLFNRFVTIHVCECEPSARAALGLVPLVGIGLHSFLDGVIYSITFTAGVFTGILAAIGMVLHEFPEGVITYLLLVRSGYEQRKALWLAFLVAGVSTPFGTLVSFPMVARLHGSLLGALLAVSAGALVYVGATHLLPQAEKESSRHGLAAFAGGILVALGIVLVESR